MALPISTLGLHKAAILMVLLGEESASHIYRNLPEGDVERLTRRIAELEHFKPETAMVVSELVVFEESGHMTFVEENERYLATVGEFLDRHRV